MPLWGWYQCHDAGRKRSDLRTSRYAHAPGEYVLIECELPDASVVLSDFDAWHFWQLDLDQVKSFRLFRAVGSPRDSPRRSSRTVAIEHGVSGLQIRRSASKFNAILKNVRFLVHWIHLGIRRYSEWRLGFTTPAQHPAEAIGEIRKQPEALTGQFQLN